jgi:integrase
MKLDKTGIDPYDGGKGGFEVRVEVKGNKERCYFPPGTSYADMQQWRTDAKQRLRWGLASSGTFAADIVDHLHRHFVGRDTLKGRRAQQLAWWAAQPAKLDAPVRSVRVVRDEAKRVKAGGKPDDVGTRLSDVKRCDFDVERLQQILDEGFKAPGADPLKHASTSSHYRTALYFLHTMLDKKNAHAVNPLDKVDVRQQRGAQYVGVDMRIVKLILDELPTKFGRDGLPSLTRAAVLAWCPITPKQLKELDVEKDFHDVAGVSRDDIIDGAVRVRLQPRFKGKRKVVPPPSWEVLTPYGVEALRTFAVTPEAWGAFSCSSLNKAVKAACRRVEERLREQGIRCDLSWFTLYKFKHSLAACMEAASGLVDASGRLKQSEGVQKVLGHERGSTTRFYTQGAVEPLKLAVNVRTSLYLDELLSKPLVPAPKRESKLRRVK